MGVWGGSANSLCGYVPSHVMIQQYLLAWSQYHVESFGLFCGEVDLEPSKFTRHSTLL